MNYNAPSGSEDYPGCPWHGNAGISDSPLQSKCIYCGEYHDDNECEVHSGLVFCSECVNAINQFGDGMEEEIKHYLTSRLKARTA